MSLAKLQVFAFHPMGSRTQNTAQCAVFRFERCLDDSLIEESN